MKKIQPDDVPKEITRMLQDYVRDMPAIFEDEITKESRSVVRKMKLNSPEGKGSKRRKFRNGWRADVVGSTVTFWNKGKPQLTHLVEFGTGNRKNKSGANRGRMRGSYVMTKSTNGIQKKLIERISKRIKRK